MISKEKVRLMTKAAIFERKERTKALETSRYRRKDYIFLHVILIWLGAMAAGGLGIGLLIMYQVVNGTSATVFQFTNMGFWAGLILGFLVLLSVLYINIGYQCYSRKYDRDQEKFKEYKEIIGQLDDFYKQE